MNEAVKGHLLAIFTAICWGTTFISTKILLVDFSPLEILVTRFVIGLTVLYMIRPHVLKLRHEEHRLYLVVAALSGITLYYLMDVLKKRNPASMRLCTLLDKPERRVKDVKVDYCGFEIPDEFVVGYGLDYAQKYRNLPYIGVVEGLE